MTKKKLIDELTSLRNSCLEGADGTWDPSGEGKESFEPMAETVERIAKHLKIKLPDYVKSPPDDIEYEESVES